MSEQYAREILRRNVAQICQTIGWNGINSTPLDILVHILEKHIKSLGTQANRYAEQFNRTEPNLHDLGLVFQDLNVQVSDLAEYTRCVPPVPPPVHIDKFPKPKDSNLNFLKPGSHEVVTRPMHVHEHLPPMYPEKERDTPAVAGTVEIQQNGIDNTDISATSCPSPEISVTDSPDKSKEIFKRPTDPISLPNSKRPRLRLDEEERTREISSVMMTMSGFLSPAREGKLPEARPPTIISEKHVDKHKVNAHHTHPAKAPIVDKSDKKSKKNKLLNGKIMKSKRKDKSHKGESSKSKDSSKLNKHAPGYTMKPKDAQANNLIPTPITKVPKAPKVPKVPKAPKVPRAPKGLLPPSKSILPPPPTISSIPEPMKALIKQEPVDPPSQTTKGFFVGEETIPVPRKIPISKSPLISTSVPVHKTSTNPFITETEIKKEKIDEDEKLASQPDRSKINIFKRISNKSKEDKSVPEVVSEKPQSDTTISRMQQKSAQNDSPEKQTSENARIKQVETIVNNNDTMAVDLSKEMDLRAHEVINIDDDSMDTNAILTTKTVHPDILSSIPVSKSYPTPLPKDVPSASPKVKKEKKHKDKKDKAAKLEAKLLKKQQQQQLAYEKGQPEKHKLKLPKPPKSRRPKNESKMSQLLSDSQFPYNLIGMPPLGRKNLMPGPGLIPNAGLIPGNEFMAGLSSNPALRGLPSTNILTNPFASGPGLIPASSFLQGGLPSTISNPLISVGNFPHSSRSSSVKIPPLLRRPDLEVIPVDNDDDRGLHKSPVMAREKDRHDKHKSPTIPNILQKHKSKSHKDHKSLFKMPPVQPDITIELNPPKEIPRQELPKELAPPPTLPRTPTPEHIEIPKLEPLESHETTSAEVSVPKEAGTSEKKKEKAHKKEKKDKDGTKIKKKKDKKDKNKDKSEKKREKEERHELKEKLKKQKKDKKKDKSGEGLVPKLTLKLGTSNSKSPMHSGSPDVFKLNIKPVVKKEDEESSLLKVESVSREHSRSPELAQISALVTRPPKPPKPSKQNHVVESEAQSSSPPSGSSPPTRKNRPPSSHSKYKRILIKPLSKKGHFDDDMASMSEEPAASQPPTQISEKSSGQLPTPFYVDDQGNKIWVCPACGRPDNGSPMIGCDGCDGWYHWVCVGITEEPGATEDWFCKSCLAKCTPATMPAGGSSAKKRGRKPKGEKIRDCH